MQRYGLSHAVEGDLVYVHEDEEGREVKADGQQERSYEKEVRLVTEEEGREGSVPITRVVLPLPGVSVVYPSSECGGQYKLRCEARGVSLEAFRNKAQSEYTLGGDYRKVVEKPGNFEWKVRMYEREKNERLVESDVDVLVRKEEEEEGREGGREGLPMYWKRFAKELRREEEGEGAGEGGGEGGGEKGSRALVVSFTLPPSTYATMLLRELLKVSMTTQEMKKLNDPPSLPASLPSAKAVLMEVEEEGGKEGGEEEGEGEGKEEQAQEA